MTYLNSTPEEWVEDLTVDSLYVYSQDAIDAECDHMEKKLTSILKDAGKYTPNPAKVGIDPTVKAILSLVRVYAETSEEMLTVKYKPDTKEFFLVWEVEFKQPTDDGGYYWETEIASYQYYKWQTLGEALEWVIQQSK